jgi:hypothetical protein
MAALYAGLTGGLSVFSKLMTFVALVSPCALGYRCGRFGRDRP